MKTIQAGTRADRPVTKEVLNEAFRRGLVRQKSSVQATAVSFVEPCLAISFIDGSGVLLLCSTIRNSMILRSRILPT